jgi:uncharacterized sulfatase
MNRNLLRAATAGVSLLPLSVLGQVAQVGQAGQCSQGGQGGIDGATERQKGAPNIVVIIADDLASYELSCYGGQNLATPNIDRLAREGVQFSRNYASCAMSVPIRASMYTGLFPVRNGSYQNHKDTYDHLETVADYLPRLGYRVGRTGKDHPVAPKSIYRFENVPGFTVECTARRADYTVDGISEFISRDNDPFCLFVCSIHPHAPWTWGDPGEFDPDKLVMSPHMVDTPGMRKIFTQYLAEVRALDNEVGSVMEVLEQSGKLDNTLVVFLGEQGPQYPGAKWTCWNPGQNSALLARYPAAIEAGSTSDAIVQYEDILPTLIDFAGGEPIAGLDGVSFLDCLYGNRPDHREYAYGLHNNFPEGRPYPIRSITDGRWKLIVNLTPEVDYHEKHLMNPALKEGPWVEWNRAAEQGGHGLFIRDRFVRRPAIELYDLKNDPFEMKNLADRKKHAQRILELQVELYKWMSEQGDRGAAMDVEFKNERAKSRNNS